MQRFVKAMLHGELPSEPLFAPLLSTAVSKVVGIPPSQLFRNPTKLANGLRQLQGPLRCDVLDCCSDLTLLAEALGASLDWSTGAPRVVAGPQGGPKPDEVVSSGRIPVVLEVIHRLRLTLRDRVALLLVLPGPLTLAMQLSASAEDVLEPASRAILAVARAACEAGSDIIMFVEVQAVPAAVSGAWAASVETIANVVRFHEALPVVMSPGVETATPGLDHLPTPWVLTVSQLVRPEFIASNNLFGVALPPAPILDPVPHEVMAALGRKECVLLTTTGNIPDELEPRAVMPHMRALRALVTAT
jgi:hypothetical protein